jgi:O-methyltransferase
MKSIKNFLKRIITLGHVNTQKNVFIKDLLKKQSIIAEAKDEENLIMNTCSQYSMTPKIRMWALIQSIKYLIGSGIEGDIVETGVFKGGNLILSKKILNSFNISNRKIYGYDTFEGMTEPTGNDKDIFGENPFKMWKKSQKKDYNDWCYASIEEVQKNFEKETGNSQSLNLVKGPVEKTLLNEENLPNKISLLRLDTDWYESSKIELEVLYPRLVKGGVLIIDDYGHWEGVKKSVDEYFFDKNIWLHYVDYGCRLLIK